MKYKEQIPSVLHDKLLIFKLFIILGSYIDLAYMHCIIIKPAGISAYLYCTDNILSTFIDLMIIYTIPLLVIKKKNYLFFIPLLITTLLAFINILYSRYFNSYLPFSQYLDIQNLNGLSSNIIDAFNIQDLVLIIPILIAIFYYKKYSNEFKLKYKYAPFKLIFFFILISGIYSSKHMIESIKQTEIHFLDLSNSKSKLEYMQDIIYSEYEFRPSTSVYKYGFFCNLSITLYQQLHHKKINSKELDEIAPYIQSTFYKHKQTTPQNLLLILVESLSSFPIDKIYDGIEITPNLNSLKKTCFYNSNMKSETQFGESSDGQFIYLTGILPIKNKITINEFADNTFITIPSLLKKQNAHFYTQMIIPTDKSMWGQDKMCKSYNIDTLFFHDHYIGKSDTWLNDRQLFALANDVDSNIQQPFFSIILTSSTHSPYKKCYEDIDMNFPTSYSNEERIYLKNIHYMDKYLGIYLQKLKEKGLYDNTLIIILADHKPNVPKLNTNNKDLFAKIPIFIVNSPVDIPLNSTTPIYQSSVFPTILDLMNIDCKWRGVGQSILIPDSIKLLEHEIKKHQNRENISKILLESDYMRNYYKQ